MCFSNASRDRSVSLTDFYLPAFKIKGTLFRLPPDYGSFFLVFLAVLQLLAISSESHSAECDFPEYSSGITNEYRPSAELQYFQNLERVPPPAILSDSLQYDSFSLYSDANHAIAQLLAEFYASSGYFSARIDSIVWDKPVRTDRRIHPPSRQSGDSRYHQNTEEEILVGQPFLSIFTSPGCRYNIGAIEYDLQNSDKDLLDHYTAYYGPGSVYYPDRLEAEFRSMIRYLENKGYPLARIGIISFEPEPETCTVDIAASVITGPVFYASGVRTNEIRQASPSYIQTASGIRERDLITLDLLQRGRRNLEQTGFFSNVSHGDIFLQNNQAFVHYDVIERRANHFDLMIGYIPGSTADNNIVGRGEMLVRNVAWEGSSLNLMFDRLESLVTRFEAGMDRQWITGLPIGAGIQFRFVQQDSSYQVRNARLRGSYMRTPERTVYVTLNHTSSSAGTGIDSRIYALDGTMQSAGFGFRFDNTDSRFTPRRGMIFDIYAETGYRRITDNRANDFDSKKRMVQQILSARFNSFHSLWPRHIIAFRLIGEAIESPVYTETDMIALGGARSLRGYREEQFRAARVAWADLEYRYLLDPFSHAFLFGAFGGYDRPKMPGLQNPGSKALLYSGGFGFRYRTPIGLVQFTYAISADDPLLNGKVHFSITAEF